MLEEIDTEKLATSVLSLMNTELKQHVLAPFRNEKTLINYVRQILDFWSYDTRTNAAQVQVPVLFIVSEYDKVASPAMSDMMAAHFPLARSVHIQGATHYCLYDRPDLIATLLENFFRDPDRLDGIDGAVRKLAL
jgi:pimeloyl-ACP methyl ester carboxylesterase